MGFVAIPFDAETDSDRPIIGAEAEHDGILYIIEKVGHIELRDVILGNEPLKGDYDNVLFKQHSTRPAVIWVTWLNQKK